MRLAELLDSKGRAVYTIRPGDAIRDVVNRLVEHNIGALPVVDESDKLVGIITERDILRLATKCPADLGAIHVRDYMSRNLVTATPNATVDDAQSVMTNRRVRHLPVVEDGKLVGLVSIGDLVKVKLADAEFEARHLADFVMGKYPA
ncbi:CBS domain-containing protein [bacterium]|nr:CBS domain-containing protein [bacterium]MBU1984181.1 CBS domain-containing protein [bacterium]